MGTPGGGGEVFWQGSSPWIAFPLAKGGHRPPQQTDRPSALDRARALDSSWETAGHTQDGRCGERRARAPPRGCMQVRLAQPGARAAPAQLRGWEERGFSFNRLKAGTTMKSWTSPVSACVH